MLWSMAATSDTKVPMSSGAAKLDTSQMNDVVFTPNSCSSNSSLLMK